MTGRIIQFGTSRFLQAHVDLFVHEAREAGQAVRARLDELAEAGLSTLPSAKVKPPRIAESPVALECETFQLIPAGRHTIVLGRVLAMHIRDDCVLDPAKRYVDTPKLGLVGRMHGRGWYVRTTDRFEVKRVTAAEWEARKRAAE